ncbi:hypothetical protein [Luteimicrobium subarcticum]|uniref:Uncharacterized protein n=1 Tax=Luteimicrobium subarcticum TaxID=620910 RepID=A0A2M8W400_9MICO|nr:hypothetical protein [Luteimicrobium subarcticum]PJI85654.1 hypothetical protein CLV34_2838 [Luteimicrobium subarcticum]
MTTPQGMPGPVPPYGWAPPPGAQVPGQVPGQVPVQGPRRRTPGATALIVIGACVLVGAMVAGVVAAVLFVRVLPTDIVTSDGHPGSASLASGTAPGDATLGVDAGERYAVWSARNPGTQASTPDDVTVVCDGAPVAVTGPSVSGSVTTSGTSAYAAAEFVAPSDGTCTVTVTEPLGRTFVVADADSFGAFFGGVAATVLLTFAAIGLGLVGAGLLVGGIIWKVVARSR